MGKTLIILLAYTISNVFLFSCKDESQERQIISQAEKLVALYPDSALVVLDSIVFPEEISRPLAARWSLLYARSADKAGKHLPYVNQLELSVDYYRSEKLLSELAETGFYLGRSYVEEKNYDKAMIAYVDALSVALGMKDYNRAGYICSYMADLYEIDGSYQKSAEKYEEGNLYFKKAGNIKSYAFGLVNAAFGYVVREEKQKALGFLLLADSVAEVLEDPKLISYVCNGLGNFYEEFGMYDLAERYIKKSLAQTDSAGILSVYISLAGILSETNRTKEAYPYLKEAEKLLDGRDDKIRMAAINYQYYRIAKNEEDYKNALYHLEEYMFVADSVDKEQESMNLLDIENKYNYVKVHKGLGTFICYYI